MPEPVRPLLEVVDLEVRYGDVRAVNGVSLSVAEGEIVALLGSNGAGKTSTLSAMSGLVTPSGGRISFEGRRIDHLPAHRIVELGIAQVPEGRRLWPELTVLEALDLGAYARRARADRRPAMEEVFHLFPRLRERSSQACGTLSGGEQQMVAIGRALMSKPRLLLFDEPSLGLAPLLVETMFEAISRIRDREATVLLVEQNLNQALEVADRGYVLETGRIVAQGPSDKLLDDPAIKSAYLGI